MSSSIYASKCQLSMRPCQTSWLSIYDPFPQLLFPKFGLAMPFQVPGGEVLAKPVTYEIVRASLTL